MTKTEKLHNLAEINNVSIHFFDLKDSVGTLGLNVKKDGLPHMIFLDHSLKNDIRLYTEVLAHELGHYFTTVGDLITNSRSYSKYIQNEKYETKANRWAYDFLIPVDEICNAIQNNIQTLYELAEYFDVYQDFLIKRFEYLALKHQTLSIDNNKTLILTNLPNIYIFEPI